MLTCRLLAGPLAADGRPGALLSLRPGRAPASSPTSAGALAAGCCPSLSTAVMVEGTQGVRLEAEALRVGQGGVQCWRRTDAGLWLRVMQRGGRCRRCGAEPAGTLQLVTSMAHSVASITQRVTQQDVLMAAACRAALAAVLLQKPQPSVACLCLSAQATVECTRSNNAAWHNRSRSRSTHTLADRARHHQNASTARTLSVTACTGTCEWLHCSMPT
jgi:hypothetical protein